jgi:hypothetical protein
VGGSESGREDGAVSRRQWGGCWGQGGGAQVSRWGNAPSRGLKHLQHTTFLVEGGVGHTAAVKLLAHTNQVCLI